MSFLEYPKVILYAKFEHFWIIRFWVVLCTLWWKCTYWPCNLDLWPFNPKTIPFLGYPNVIRFRVMLWTNRQTDRQTNRRTRTSYTRRPPLLQSYYTLACMKYHDDLMESSHSQLTALTSQILDGVRFLLLDSFLFLEVILLRYFFSGLMR